MLVSSKKELKKMLDRERIAKFICAELNNFVDLKPTLITIIKRIQDLTHCEAVSIRLHDNGDYPYYVYSGFPESFIKKENSLCQKDDTGNRIPSPDGKGYLLECMCGNIIRGRFDPSLPFFSKKGSFWSNNTSALLASTTEEERQSHTRNECNACGYESVALIPIKIKDERIGLIQLNDMRKGMFTEDAIEYMEMIAEQIGLAVQNSLIYTRLKETLEEIKILRGIIPICANCKKIRDDKGYWQQVEIYIRDHSEADFTHGICPDCAKKLYSEFYKDTE